MTFQYPPILPLYVVAVFFSFFVCYRAYLMQPARGSLALTCFAFCGGFWALNHTIGITLTELPIRLFFVRITYIGIIGTAYFWFIFALTYSRYDYLLTRKRAILIAIIPLVALLFVFTSQWHTLFYISTSMQLNGDLVVFTPVYGPLFWAWAAYGYLLMLSGAGVLIVSILRFPNSYRGQALFLLLGIVVPLTFNFSYVAGFDLLNTGGYDPSSLGYSIFAVFALAAMGRYDFLDVVPVAYDLVFKGMHEGVIVINEDGKILDINPAAVASFPQTHSSLVGQSVQGILPLNDFLQLDLATEDKQVIELNNRHYELQIMPFKNRRGERNGRILMLYDVTELTAVVNELDAFSHMVAHDLKNPLNGVISYADYIENELLTDDGLDEELPEVVSEIRRGGRQMSMIIDNLLLLASVRNQVPPIEKITNMEELIQNALSGLTLRIRETGADITVPEKWCLALGYGPWIQEIWANYISNALKYGGDSPHVILGCDQLPNGRVRFWVKDNGDGLTQEQQQEIFAPFQRLVHHNQLAGHGLGLSIVKKISDRLDAEVGVQSEIGQGSLFYFTLARADV